MTEITEWLAMDKLLSSIQPKELKAVGMGSLCTTKEMAEELEYA